MTKLEAGSNFFELIEFELERDLGSNRTIIGSYGVNVAKVREVIRVPKFDPLASTIPSIVGIFALRNVPIPVVSLNHFLGDPRGVDPEPTHVIIAEFSMRRAGFLVRNTKKIRRVSWDKVLPPSSDSDSCVTGMILKGENEFLYILDLEKIIFELEHQASGRNGNESDNIFQNTNLPLKYSDKSSSQENHGSILVVDDSKLVLSNIQRSLTKIGFTIQTANNGKAALEILQQTPNASSLFRAIITDIEMPIMDGLSLTKEVKSNEIFKHIPVILHTSLGGYASKEAGQKVGANAYVVKNDIKALMQTLDKILSSSNQELTNAS